MLIDLHTHSHCSDGTDSPAELIGHAVEASLHVVALTDHDTADGWDEAEQTAACHELRLITGMELSCRYDDVGVHLLAYQLDPTFSPLAKQLERILAGRTSRLPVMLARLRGAGVDITEDDVARASGSASATGRPHVADAMVALGVVRDRSEAFSRYLAWGRPGYVRRYATEVTQMIELVRQAGGVSVIAHPWSRGSRRVLTAEVLGELADAGLTGIEVDHRDQDPQTRASLRSIAADVGLVATGGSDYHGAGKLDHPLGGETTAPDQFERLLAALP
ncbi:MAG TPA: PHP domain-containing protein [Nocardioidaceae bacterium]|nr:PHP domain-containing protein [Nocardioidaceae bacterium]